ncbi:MAG: hypothetical protein KC877_03630 [Candidatus Kaiserbacteria bacterium]|nr:hypothetical protein [Candidatus Kaiserbacteria bacterium]
MTLIDGGHENDIAMQQLLWQQIFDDLQVECSVSDVRLPIFNPRFAQLIVVPSITLLECIDLMDQEFPIDSPDRDLSEVPLIDDWRRAEGPYAIWVRKRFEADFEHQKKSAVHVRQSLIPGITLLERLLLELFYYRYNGKHLDADCITLCTGTQTTGSFTPGFGWDADHCRVRIDWFAPDYASIGLRVREVIT